MLGINRSILVCSSPLFASLLSDQDNLKDEQQLIFTDINQRDLEFYVHFVTTGTLPCESIDEPTITNFAHLGVDLNKIALEPAPSIKYEKTQAFIVDIKEIYRKETSENPRKKDNKRKIISNFDLGDLEEYMGPNDELSDFEEDVKPKRRKIKHEEDQEDPEFDPKNVLEIESSLPKISNKSKYQCKMPPGKKRGRPSSKHKGDTCLNMLGVNDDYGVPALENPSDYFHFPMEGERNPAFDYQCKKCVRGFEHPHQLTQHLYRHESKAQSLQEAWSCDLCDGREKFSNPMELVDHKSQSHEGYKKCETCQGLIDLGDPKSRKAHGKRNKCDDASVFCVCCGLKCTHESHLKRHVKNHGGEEFHGGKCAYTEECPGVVFKLWSHHLYHIRTVHGGIQKVTCKFCPESFFTDEEKKRHVKVAHRARKVLPSEEGGGERDLSLKFQCPICVEGFDKKYLLNDHLMIHDEQNGGGDGSKWLCPFCPEGHGTDTVFESFEKLNNHKRSLHYIEDVSNGTWKCVKCREEFRAVQSIEWHIRKHHPTGSADNKECVCCGKQFHRQDVKGYKQHIEEQGKFHNNKCPLCPGVSFSTFKDHKEHVAKFHGGKFVSRCSQCPQVFEDEQSKHEHEMEAHVNAPLDDPSTREKVTCEFCDKVVYKDYMEKHIRYTHGEKKWYCEKCPNVFTSRERLKVHFDAQHVHATCEICGALVKGLYNMKRHKSVEHDPKAKCDICGEMIPAYRLKFHKKSHMPDDQMPYKCSFCSKGFIQRNKLNDHENMHRGEKPHKCEQCNVAYTDKANLNAHIRSVHLGIKRKQKRS